jgi:hypothetical protein
MITKASRLGAVIAAAATLSALVGCGSTTTDSTSSTSEAASTAAIRPPRSRLGPIKSNRLLMAPSSRSRSLGGRSLRRTAKRKPPSESRLCCR